MARKIQFLNQIREAARSHKQWLAETFAAADPASRRVRLLTYLHFAILCMLIVTIIVVQTANSALPYFRQVYTIIVVSVAALVIAAYFLNRHGHYRLSSVLTVYFSSLAPWASILLDPRILQRDGIPVAYVAVAVLLCSLLLSRRWTFLLIALHAVAFCVAFAMFPVSGEVNWPSVFILIGIISAVGLVSSGVMNKDLEQIDRQTSMMLAQESRLRVASERDVLTGVYNRYYFEEVFSLEIQKAAQESQTLSIILLDLDYFKKINDSLGHVAGDELLRRIGDWLRSQVRTEDIACRYGGDEFVVLLPGTAIDTANRRAKSMLNNLRAQEIALEGCSLKNITISCGIASFPEHGATDKELLLAADAALYRAKRAGRGRVVSAEKSGMHAAEPQSSHELLTEE